MKANTASRFPIIPECLSELIGSTLRLPSRDGSCRDHCKRKRGSGQRYPSRQRKDAFARRLPPLYALEHDLHRGKNPERQRIR